MAITEKELPGGQWERKATGADIPKLLGSLTKTGNESYRKSFHENEKIGFEKMTMPDGRPDWVRKDRVDEVRRMGYGATGDNPRMVCPALPWQEDRLPGETWSKYQARRQSLKPGVLIDK